MHPLAIEILKFSVYTLATGDTLFGTWHTMADGSEGLQSARCHGGLGSEPLGKGTVTGALRQFNLPTSRAPGDWPGPTANGTVRF